MRKRTMTKRFYVGSARMVEGGDCNHFMRLLPEAIEEGKKRLIASGADEIYIVEVVRVIRRETPPLVVEATR